MNMQILLATQLHYIVTQDENKETLSQLEGFNSMEPQILSTFLE